MPQLTRQSAHTPVMRSVLVTIRPVALSLLGSLLVIFVTSCATPYQPMSALGGYREVQLFTA
jgi:hypothetical protein